MWAMIGTCIAMAIWTSGLLYMTTRSEERRVAHLLSRESVDEGTSSSKEHDAGRIPSTV